VHTPGVAGSRELQCGAVAQPDPPAVSRSGR